jgi:hypothetical protein
MKKLFLMLAVLSAATANAQININNIGNQINNAVNGNGQTLSNDEVIRGLKEALSVGSKNSSDRAAKIDGFYKNPNIKIPFPKEAQEMERVLKNAGMTNQVNNFVLTLNRAAEEAAKDAAPIFLNAITSMSIADGFSILKGGDNAATTFLKDKTNAELLVKFKPVVASALQKVQVTKYWNPLVTKYNKIPMTKKMNPNLEEYVTKKAIEGLFKLVAEEELKIRKDPGSRVTDILKKVFG